MNDFVSRLCLLVKRAVRRGGTKRVNVKSACDDGEQHVGDKGAHVARVVWKRREKY